LKKNRDLSELFSIIDNQLINSPLKAIELLEDNSEHFEDDILFFLRLGELYFEQKKYDSALLSFSRALELEPENVEVLSHISDVYIKKNDYTQAEVALLKAIEYEPKNALLLSKLANLYFDIGKYYESQQLLIQAIEEEPKAEYYSLLATIYKKMDNDIACWNTLVKAEQLFPKNINILNQIGAYYFDLDNYSKALSYFQSALDLDPENQYSLFQLAKTFEKMNDPYNAIDIYSKIVEINPDHALAYYYLGKLYSSLGDFAQSLTCYSKCLELDPSFFDAALDLASIHWVSKNYNKAISVLEETLKFSKEDEIYKMMINIYEEIGEETKAKYYRKLLEKNNNED